MDPAMREPGTVSRRDADQVEARTRECSGFDRSEALPQALMMMFGRLLLRATRMPDLRITAGKRELALSQSQYAHDETNEHLRLAHARASRHRAARTTAAA